MTFNISDDCEAIQHCPASQQDLRFEDEAEGYADDATWILTASFAILTMQSGFGLLEIGISMSGNEVNILLKNVYDVVFGALAYYTLGFGISYGTPSSPFMGLGDFVAGSRKMEDFETGLFHSRYLFQFSFAATSTTIVSGCVAMRMRFFVYCIFSFFAVIFYSFVVHWFWADDGWLRQMGVHDFAGAGPVHLFGGINGFIVILMLGPRSGRFDVTRDQRDFAPSSPTSMLFGLFMLWWGWIGFNCGSSFGITGIKWLVAIRAGVTTINAAAGGGIAALLYTQISSRGKYVRPGDVVNGILGALVSTTATCASIHNFDALIIGVIGAFIALGANSLIEHRVKLDDPVGAIGVHAGSAMWGLIAVGLFADGSMPGIDVENGLFRGGGWNLLGIQCLAIVSVIGWSIVWCVPFFYLIGILISKNWKDPRKGLRIDEEEELIGADEFLHNCSRANIEALIEETVRRLGIDTDEDIKNNLLGKQSADRKKEEHNCSEANTCTEESVGLLGIDMDDIIEHNEPQEQSKEEDNCSEANSFIEKTYGFLGTDMDEGIEHNKPLKKRTEKKKIAKEGEEIKLQGKVVKRRGSMPGIRIGFIR